MVTDGNQTYPVDHFIIYKNIKSLCCTPGTNIVFQVNYTSKTNRFIESRFVATRGRGWRERELDEGGQKVQTYSYKANKYQGCNVQPDKDN